MLARVGPQGGLTMAEACDVIVVGAGLAGAMAARTLARRGLEVQVLEARRRAGGRAFTRPFAGSGEALDFGGGWVLPGQPLIHAVAAELGLAWRPSQPVTARRWLRPGGLAFDRPAADGAAYDACLAQVAADAARYDAGAATDALGRPLAGLSFADYLDRLAADADTRAQFEGWWCLSGSGDPGVVGALEFIASSAHAGGRPDGLLEAMSERPAAGAQALAEGLLRQAGVPVAFGQAVRAVEQDGQDVRLRLADGRRLAARAVLLATGVNPLRDITFTPPLRGLAAGAVAEGHHGRAVKLWLRAEGVPLGSLAVGAGPGLRWLFAERPAAAGGCYLVGFGLAEPGRPPGRDYAATALAAFFPEARLLGWDWHDWLLDPWALGTWAAPSVTCHEGFSAAAWAPQGHLYFASSDFASEGSGWFEGALRSGAAAAAAVAARFG